MSPTIAPIQPETATGVAKELLDQVQRSLGLVPEMTKVMADKEIGDVVANLALNILTNYFNVLAGVKNDWPVVTL